MPRTAHTNPADRRLAAALAEHMGTASAAQPLAADTEQRHVLGAELARVVRLLGWTPPSRDTTRHPTLRP